MNRLKYFIALIRLRTRHNRCYKANERCGFAVFGMCKGHYHEGKIPYEGCSICPYFENINDTNN